jgi:hypothetical protein
MAATDYASVAEVVALNEAKFSAYDADEMALIIGGADLTLADSITRQLLDAGAWGIHLKEAHRYYAAHWVDVVLGSGGASGGAVTSRTVDKVSESYATVAASVDAELGSTPYGRAFLALRRRLTPAISHGETSRGWEASGGGL